MPENLQRDPSSFGDATLDGVTSLQRQYNDAVPIPGQLSSAQQCSTELGEAADLHTITGMVFLVLLILTVGIVSIHIQCRRLQWVLRKRQEVVTGGKRSVSSNNNPPTHDVTSDIDIQAARQTRKIVHQASYETLKAELMNLREIQQSVREQVLGLEQFVARRAAVAASADGTTTYEKGNEETSGTTESHSVD